MDAADERGALAQTAPGAPFDRVNAKLLEGFAALCAQCGGDAAALLARAGIACFPESLVPLALTYPRFVALLAEAARSLDCPDFGMRLARAQSGTDLYGPLGGIMRRARTLGEALDYVIARSDVHSPAARISKHALPGRTAMVYSHEIIVGQFAGQGQAIEYMLLAGHIGAAALTGGRARARQVILRHRPISPMATYRRYFGCEVLFDQMLDGIIFTREDLDCAIIGHDPALYSELIAAVEARFARPAPPIEAAARAALLRLVHVGMASNEELAADLGMHLRTLHRRLAQAGTTFQALKNEVRCELARYYLAHTELKLSWISGRLGFSEQAAFTHFCKRHLGVAPRALRQSGGSRSAPQPRASLASAARPPECRGSSAGCAPGA